jgi:hypothetical protein
MFAVNNYLNIEMKKNFNHVHRCFHGGSQKNDSNFSFIFLTFNCLFQLPTPFLKSRQLLWFNFTGHLSFSFVRSGHNFLRA